MDKSQLFLLSLIGLALTIGWVAYINKNRRP